MQLQVCYYFGIGHQIRLLFSKAKFREARKIKVDFSKPGSWFSSWHARWINGRTGGAATHENNVPLQEGLGEAFEQNNGVYSLHFDWIQVNSTRSKSKSLGVIMLRNDSIDESVMNVDEFGAPVMVMEGQPACMDIHWKIIADEFARLERDGIEIQYPGEHGVVQFNHKAFLVRVFCDAKAREKLLKCRGANAKRPCPYCPIESSGNAKIFGYNSPISCTEYDLEAFVERYRMQREDFAPVPPPGSKKDILIGDADRPKYDTKSLRKRYELIHEANNMRHLNSSELLEIKQTIGLNGMCHIAWHDDLTALHPLHFVYLPLFHLLILGLVEKFLVYMFKAKKDEWETRRSEMQPVLLNIKNAETAMKGVIRNCDLQDEQIDMRNWSGFLISNLMDFLETYSCYLFNEEVIGFKLLSDEGLRAWGLLRRAVLYFVRDTEGMYEQYDEKREEASKTLLEYAKICEQFMPDLCVQNLHIAVCRLAEQEKICGRPNLSHDMFTERTIRIAKQLPYKDNHALSFTRRWLLKETGVWLKDKKGYSNPFEKDRGTMHTHCIEGPMGHGHEITEDFLRSSLITQFEIEDEETGGRGPLEQLEVYKVLEHNSALLHRGGRYETIKSTADLRENEKFSKLVLIDLEQQTRLALITKIFQVIKGEQPIGMGAICNVLKYEDPIFHPDSGIVYKFKKYCDNGNISGPVDFNECDFEEMHLSIPLSDIQTKVSMYVRPGDLRAKRNETIRSGYYWVYCASNGGRSGQFQRRS